MVAEVANDHNLVWTEQMMPVFPVTRVPTVAAAIDLAVESRTRFPPHRRDPLNQRRHDHRDGPGHELFDLRRQRTVLSRGSARAARAIHRFPSPAQAATASPVLVPSLAPPRKRGRSAEDRMR